MTRRPRLVVATSFPVHPPAGGGQVRVAGLYGALARGGVDVEIVALVDRTRRARTLQPLPGLRETQVPKTAAHEGAEAELQRRAGVPVSDLGLALHHDLTPAYGEQLARAAREADAVVACHPFPYPALAACDRPLIYEAQDVEADLKAPMYEAAADGAELAQAVRDVEAACCAAADHVTVCADADGRRLQELYGVPGELLATVPNGADPTTIAFVDLPERRARQHALGLGEELLAAFVGSWHEPNLIAVQDLLRLAPELEGVRVVVVGSAGLPFEGKRLPATVDVCGVVDGGFLRALLSVADAALNPMRWGSGTNLKMLDYALAGVPLVSSAFGTRGFDLEDGRHYLAAEPDDLPAVLADLRSEDDAVTAARVRAARSHAERRFSWKSIANRWRAHDGFARLLGAVEALT